MPASCDAGLLAELAHEVMHRCDLAASCTEVDGEITRTFCSPAMGKLHALLRNWLEAAGMHSRIDAAGNLIGRFDATGAADAPALLIGSHLDTVANAGRYDGVLGVMLAVTLVDGLHRSGISLPFAIEVIAFSEEEGVRFGRPFIGSKALVGECGELLDCVDASGISIRAALELFGCPVAEIAAAAIDPARVIAFLEPHIEQGPILQSQQLPLAVVTAIAGQTRAAIRFVGSAGHAGTVPMHLRRDALAAAAEWIAQVERIAQATNGLVATVGVVEVLPNVSNVIPAEARLRLDVRHAEDAVRSAAVESLRRIGSELATRRGIDFHFDLLHEHHAVTMNAPLTSLLEQSIRDAGATPLRLTSGAGHDAAVIAQLFPTAMLFLRCRDGISHHPDESVAVEDVAAALAAMWQFVGRLAAAHSSRKDA